MRTLGPSQQVCKDPTLSGGARATHFWCPDLEVLPESERRGVDLALLILQGADQAWLAPSVGAGPPTWKPALLHACPSTGTGHTPELLWQNRAGSQGP